MLPEADRYLAKTTALDDKQRKKEKEKEKNQFQISNRHSRDCTYLKKNSKKMSPYRKANAKMRKALQAKRLTHKVTMRSKLLENYFVINRNELEVRIVI